MGFLEFIYVIWIVVLFFFALICSVFFLLLFFIQPRTTVNLARLSSIKSTCTCLYLPELSSFFFIVVVVVAVVIVVDVVVKHDVLSSFAKCNGSNSELQVSAICIAIEMSVRACGAHVNQLHRLAIVSQFELNAHCCLFTGMFFISLFFFSMNEKCVVDLSPPRKSVKSP